MVDFFFTVNHPIIIFIFFNFKVLWAMLLCSDKLYWCERSYNWMNITSTIIRLHTVCLSRQVMRNKFHIDAKSNFYLVKLTKWILIFHAMIFTRVWYNNVSVYIYISIIICVWRNIKFCFYFIKLFGWFSSTRIYASQ